MAADSSGAAKRRKQKAKAKQKQHLDEQSAQSAQSAAPANGTMPSDVASKRNSRAGRQRRAQKPEPSAATGVAMSRLREHWQRMTEEERRVFVEKDCSMSIADAAARVCELTSLRDDWARFFLKSALAAGFAPETRPSCPHPSLAARLLKIHVVGRSIVVREPPVSAAAAAAAAVAAAAAGRGLEYHTEDVYINTDFEVEPPAEDAHEYAAGYHIELEAEESGSEGTEGGEGEGERPAASPVLMAASCAYFLIKSKDPVLNLNTAGRADDGVEAFSLRFALAPHMDACGAWLPFQDMPPGGRVFLAWHFTDREIVAAMEGRSGRVVAGPTSATADRSEGVIDCVGLGERSEQSEEVLIQCELERRGDLIACDKMEVMIRADWLLSQWGLPLASPGPRACRHPGAPRQPCGLCAHFALGAPPAERGPVALRYAGPGELRVGLEGPAPGELLEALAGALPEEGPPLRPELAAYLKALAAEGVPPRIERDDERGEALQGDFLAESQAMYEHWSRAAHLEAEVRRLEAACAAGAAPADPPPAAPDGPGPDAPAARVELSAACKLDPGFVFDLEVRDGHVSWLGGYHAELSEAEGGRPLLDRRLLLLDYLLRLARLARLHPRELELEAGEGPGPLCAADRRHFVKGVLEKAFMVLGTILKYWGAEAKEGPPAEPDSAHWAQRVHHFWYSNFGLALTPLGSAGEGEGEGEGEAAAPRTRVTGEKLSQIAWTTLHQIRLYIGPGELCRRYLELCKQWVETQWHLRDTQEHLSVLRWDMFDLGAHRAERQRFERACRSLLSLVWLDHFRRALASHAERRAERLYESLLLEAEAQERKRREDEERRRRREEEERRRKREDEEERRRRREEEEQKRREEEAALAAAAAAARAAAAAAAAAAADEEAKAASAAERRGRRRREGAPSPAPSPTPTAPSTSAAPTPAPSRPALTPLVTLMSATAPPPAPSPPASPARPAAPASPARPAAPAPSPPPAAPAPSPPPAAPAAPDPPPARRPSSLRQPPLAPATPPPASPASVDGEEAAAGGGGGGAEGGQREAACQTEEGDDGALLPKLEQRLREERAERRRARERLAELETALTAAGEGAARDAALAAAEARERAAALEGELEGARREARREREAAQRRAAEAERERRGRAEAEARAEGLAAAVEGLGGELAAQRAAAAAAEQRAREAEAEAEALRRQVAGLRGGGEGEMPLAELQQRVQSLLFSFTLASHALAARLGQPPPDGLSPGFPPPPAPFRPPPPLGPFGGGPQPATPKEGPPAGAEGSLFHNDPLLLGALLREPPPGPAPAPAPAPRPPPSPPPRRPPRRAAPWEDPALGPYDLAGPPEGPPPPAPNWAFGGPEPAPFLLRGPPQGKRGALGRGGDGPRGGLEGGGEGWRAGEAGGGAGEGPGPEAAYRPLAAGAPPDGADVDALRRSR